MAGTNKTLNSTADPPLAPVIILVGPQLGENIGMCARAMLNCAVTELRIVNPRDGWPNEAALSASAGAVAVIEQAKLYASTKDAVADLEFVLATTVRERGIVKDIYSTETAARKIREINSSPLSPSGRGSNRCGILFGPERTGLENDDVALANAILNIPLNPGFSSLNLAQAVLLVCFTWLSAENPFQCEAPVAEGEEAPATKGDIELLLTHLEEELVKGGFFRSPEQKPTILRNIRNFFFRSSPTQQEARTLRGVVKCLTAKRGGK